METLVQVGRVVAESLGWVMIGLMGFAVSMSMWVVVVSVYRVIQHTRMEQPYGHDDTWKWSDLDEVRKGE